MIDIHPEIRKFWEDQGYTLTDPLGFFPLGNVLWARQTDGLCFCSVAIKSKTGIVQYCIDNDLYSEQETLRIIKLKAFL
jgi:hypothetical protein